MAIRKVALQMLRANVMLTAIKAALYNREIAVNGVGTNVAANVFADALIGRMMIGRTVTSACTAVIAYFGRHYLLIHDRTQGFGGHLRDVMRPGSVAALNQRENSFLALTANATRVAVALAAMSVRLLAADTRFVKLYSLPSPPSGPLGSDHAYPSRMLWRMNHAVVYGRPIMR
jgi:hypothetical protein